MIGLLLFTFLLFVAVAWTTSGAVGLLVRVFGEHVERIEPRARARVWLAATLAPMVVALGVTAGALVPREWIGDALHCPPFGHMHMHLCALHGAPHPNLVATTLVVVTALWLSWGLARAIRRAALGLRVVHAMGVAAPGAGDVRVIDDPHLCAFTSGLVRPSIFLSTAVMREPERWRAVIAHERAHQRSRDPLTRVVARLASALHLWPVADRLLVALEEAQELAADEHAAAEIGDRALVAATLVDWVRQARLSVPGVVGVEGAALERRVRALLDPPAYRRLTLPATWVSALAAGLTIAALATPLHHTLEHLLEHFAG